MPTNATSGFHQLSLAQDQSTQANSDSLLEIEWTGVRIRLGEVAGKALIKAIRLVGLLLFLLLAGSLEVDFSQLIQWLVRAGP